MDSLKKIAVIPARGGSKRIFKKNLRTFSGQPIINYSINNAIKSELFDKVVVSTDDKEIAKVSTDAGAEVPFIRPAEISDDKTGVFDVTNHVINFFANEKFDVVCTIFATAPFLDIEYLIKGYNALIKSDAKNSFSATETSFPIQRTFQINSKGRSEMFFPDQFEKRSQDLIPSYQDAGQFYWTKIINSNIESAKQMFSQNSIPIIIPKYLVVDIDTEDDWKRAESMYQYINSEKL
jgi:pseudaminic acid cytidylyltransferase